MPIQTFRLPYSETAVQDLRDRLARTRWPDAIPGSGWEYGFDLGYLQSICRYWREKFDWKAEIERLARLHHFEYHKGDQSIHFVHERGRGPAPIPILLLHGWPGSFLEMLKLCCPGWRIRWLTAGSHVIRSTLLCHRCPALDSPAGLSSEGCKPREWPTYLQI